MSKETAEILKEYYSFLAGCDVLSNEEILRIHREFRKGYLEVNLPVMAEGQKVLASSPNVYLLNYPRNVPEVEDLISGVDEMGQLKRVRRKLIRGGLENRSVEAKAGGVFEVGWKYGDCRLVKYTSPKGVEARNRIINANLKLVVHRFFKGRFPISRLDDYFSEGAIILKRAVEGFNSENGAAFSTYATRSLIGGFWDRCEKEGREKEYQHIDGEMDFIPDVRKSFNPEKGRVNGYCLKEVLSVVSERNAFILEKLGAGETMKDIGKMLGVSKARVEQLKRQAFEIVREKRR